MKTVTGRRKGHDMGTEQLLLTIKKALDDVNIETGRRDDFDRVCVMLADSISEEFFIEKKGVKKEDGVKIYKLGMSLPEIIHAGRYHGDTSLGCREAAGKQGYAVTLDYICDEWYRLDQRVGESQRKEPT